MMRVLVAEDDANIRAGLQELLEREGYDVLAAADGGEALDALTNGHPDFALLDIMMPKVDGYEVCRRIRAVRPELPVIFISAKNEEIDRVVGLELGADDFISKPFGTREVIARIRAVTRRAYASESSRDAEADAFPFGDLTIRPAELRAYRGSQVIDLSLLEVRILTLLHRRAGRVVDRDTFFNECWGLTYAPTSRTLDQHVSRLRRRIEHDPRRPVLIRTVHGVGYRYERPQTANI